VRLIDVVREDMKYATLSYCWGKEMSAGSTTTTKNVRERQQRLEIIGQSKTIQDAFTVARGLQIRYIWIDALCIIQDSDVDWASESSKMADIYARSLITIAADMSFSCSEGFLCSDTHENRPSCSDSLRELSSPLRSGCTSRIYLPKISGHICPLEETLGITSTPLSKRAWAYQERYLSARTLHFLGNQVVWECRQRDRVPIEMGVALIDVPEMHSKLFLEAGYGSVATDVLDPASTISELELLEVWDHRIVSAYSARVLSYPNDKLPALSGIAKAFHARLETKYVAGIWLHHTMQGLSWRRQQKSTSGNVQPYRAPSFSWASIEGSVVNALDRPEIYGPIRNIVHQITVEDVHIELATSDPFGRVSGGWIKLKGYFGSATLKSCTMTRGTAYGNLVCDHFYKRLARVAITLDVRQELEKEESFPFIVLSTSSSYDDDTLILLLLETRDSNQGGFKRIGLAKGYRPRGAADWIFKRYEQKITTIY
jgi:hypothetical protein